MSLLVTSLPRHLNLHLPTVPPSTRHLPSSPPHRASPPRRRLRSFLALTGADLGEGAPVECTTFHPWTSGSSDGNRYFLAIGSAPPLTPRYLQSSPPRRSRLPQDPPKFAPPTRVPNAGPRIPSIFPFHSLPRARDLPSILATTPRLLLKKEKGVPYAIQSPRHHPPRTRRGDIFNFYGCISIRFRISNEH